MVGPKSSQLVLRGTRYVYAFGLPLTGLLFVVYFDGLLCPALSSDWPVYVWVACCLTAYAWRSVWFGWLLVLRLIGYCWWGGRRAWAVFLCSLNDLGLFGCALWCSGSDRDAVPSIDSAGTRLSEVRALVRSIRRLCALLPVLTPLR